jgi:hypothetical protein
LTEVGVIAAQLDLVVVEQGVVDIDQKGDVGRIGHGCLGVLPRDLASVRFGDASAPQKLLQLSACGRPQFFLVERAVAIVIGSFEELGDGREIFVLADRPIVVGVSLFDFLKGETAVKLSYAERAILVTIELIEERGCGGIGLVHVDCAVLVRIENVHRPRSREGRAAERSGKEKEKENGKRKTWSTEHFRTSLLIA